MLALKKILPYLFVLPGMPASAQCLVNRAPASKAYYELMKRQEQKLRQKASGYNGTTAQTVSTIPVVVHVVWNTPAQNIPDAQVISQIDVLNEDFRRLNADTVNTPVPFKPFSGDAQIEFCLAQRDPQGNPTTGITHTQTSVNNFVPLFCDTAIYYTATGGHDAWDTSQYFNIWVCNSGGGMATWPGSTVLCPGMKDGAVVDPMMFGTIGNLQAPYTKGRITTHEVGHYLFLHHIWGLDTAACATDSVADTPPEYLGQINCPSFPVLDTCSPNFPGIMFMNYMDYTDDACKNQFSAGQCARMNWCLSTLRGTLLTSLACVPPAGYPEFLNSISVTASPNPSNGKFYFYVRLGEEKECSLTVVNLLGEKVYEARMGRAKETTFAVDLTALPKGIYFARLGACGREVSVKLIIR